ncbi:hypothetical protein MHYP_G00327940 [Metynnis hypsauchen]
MSRNVDLQRALEVLSGEDEDEGHASSAAESVDTDEELDFEAGIDPVEESDEPGEVLAETSTSSDLLLQRGGDGRWAPPRFTLRRDSGLPRSRSRSNSPARGSAEAQSSSQPWKTEAEPDVVSQPKCFTPHRAPGVQLDVKASYTPLDLFQLFFPADAVETICQNTNKQAAKNVAKGKKYKWTDVVVDEFYKFLGILMFTALVPLNHISDFWRRNNIFSVSFPATVMSRDRFRAIAWNVHLSDPEEDAVNERRKGTSEYDGLFQLKPLVDVLRTTCQFCYHPNRNLAVNERTVSSRVKSGVQYTKSRWGFKLFALTDCSNGYTVDFSVYAGKFRPSTGNGLSYDSVMSLIKPEYLGAGYTVFVDSFYTSPKLFRDLFSVNIGACGIYRENRKECPRGRSNSLTRKSPLGSIRWIREDPLVFVTWLDTQEVSVCSTIHPAFSGDTVQRKVKGRDGHWTQMNVPCPAPIIDYSKHMGAADSFSRTLSTNHYTAHHKTSRWYRTLFFHFVDIAATNSYILHTELCRAKRESPMTHKQFVEELTAQLCGTTLEVSAKKQRSAHVPVAIAPQAQASRKATYGRRSCVRCRKQDKRIVLTPWKCQECNVALCVILDRNCFQEWHS